MPSLCNGLCRLGSDGSPIEIGLEVSGGVSSSGVSLDYISFGILFASICSFVCFVWFVIWFLG
jgi:hypothetical protein